MKICINISIFTTQNWIQGGLISTQKSSTQALQNKLHNTQQTFCTCKLKGSSSLEKTRFLTLMNALANYLKTIKLYDEDFSNFYKKIFCDSGKTLKFSILKIYYLKISATFCYIMHEQLFHNSEMSKSTRKISNLLHKEAGKHHDNQWLNIILNDDDFSRQQSLCHKGKGVWSL